MSYNFEILVLKPNCYCCILSYQISLWCHFYSCVEFSHYFHHQNWVNSAFEKFAILGVFNFYIHIAWCAYITQFSCHGSIIKEKIEIFCFHICKPTNQIGSSMTMISHPTLFEKSHGGPCHLFSIPLKDFHL